MIMTSWGQNLAKRVWCIALFILILELAAILMKKTTLLQNSMHLVL